MARVGLFHAGCFPHLYPDVLLEKVCAWVLPEVLP